MKDKILPPEYNESTIEELTKIANEIIKLLEKEKDLNNSIENYQKLLRINNIIEKKFQKNFKSISEETRKKIRNIEKKNEKTTK